MNSKILSAGLSTLVLMLVIAGCTENPFESITEDTKTLTKTLTEADVQAAAKAKAKVMICHVTDSQTNSLVPIEVAARSLDDHFGHGDVLPGSPVDGQPGFYYSADCAPVEDTTAPTCTYEVAEDNSSLTYFAVDDLSGITSLTASCNNCSNIIPSLNGGLTASATILKANPANPTMANASFRDRAFNTSVCEAVTF